MTRSTRSLGLVATVLVSLGLLTACGSDSDPRTGASTVPDGLLSEQTVGGTAVGDAEKYLGYSAGTSAGSADEQCVLDNASLLVGASDDDAAAYERDGDGHPEIVGIAVMDTTSDAFDSAVADLEEGLARAGCRQPPTIEAAAVDLGLDGTTAFSSVKGAGTDDQKSLLRSYTYVQVDGRDKLVLVSIQRTDGTQPSPDELKKLTSAQVDRTTTALTG